MTDYSFDAVFEQRGDWVVGYIIGLPGANVQEKSIEAARESMREAVKLVLEESIREIEGSTSIISRERIVVPVAKNDVHS